MEDSNVKKSTKIPVHYYTEITKDTKIFEPAPELPKPERYITNEGGKQYLVEVWR